MANTKPVGVAYSDPELVEGTTITGATITNPTITGATLTGGAFNGTVGATTPAAGSFTTLAASTTATVTSANANALAVGRQGATNPALAVDASAATSVTGIKVASAAAAGGAAITATSSGTNESLTIDAKGTGTVTINGTATGAVIVPVGRISTSLTFGAGSSFIADNGTATSTAAAATISKMSGVITTEALTTAANGDYTFTLTNTLITANSNLLVQVGYGTATTGHPNLRKVTPGAGSATIIIHNDDAAVALNGTLIIRFFLVAP